MGDAICNSGFVDCSHRITAADNNDSTTVSGFGDGMRHTNRSFIEWRLFEYTHRAIPNDRARVLDGVAKVLDGFDPDVHAGVPGVRKLNRDRFRYYLVAFDRLVTVDDLMICRQKKLNAGRLSSLPDVICCIQH